MRVTWSRNARVTRHEKERERERERETTVRLLPPYRGAEEGGEEERTRRIRRVPKFSRLFGTANDELKDAILIAPRRCRDDDRGAASNGRSLHINALSRIWTLYLYNRDAPPSPDHSITHAHPLPLPPPPSAVVDVATRGDEGPIAARRIRVG
jgi:hypothetical protein